ncbi:MAG: polysaccharide deacetylase family protein [Candidatus Eremiobacteraeota bacterium]|nr:polysaccharide deacetylase family protein [Candidatus Eremiobacteraeota bacterium]
MAPAMKGTLAVIAVVAAIAGGWRLLVHGSNTAPALITPQTDVHMAISGEVVPRIYRAMHNVSSTNRENRPRLIALTFDDGPYPVFTPMLLDVLHDLNVPATFFLIGEDAQQWPELTRRIEAGGNEIADHTYTHPNLDQESADAVRDEILRGRDALWDLSHDPAVRSLMRPPHGRYTERTLRIAQQLGYTVVLWTDDSGDWRAQTSSRIAHHLLTNATAPEIVLLHSGKLATIEALPSVVARFRQAGYRFVTVGQMLKLVQNDELNHPLRRAV